MVRYQRLRWIIAAPLCALFTTCGVLDVFETPGPGAVTFQYAGQTDLRTGDRAAFAVTVQVDGVELAAPRLLVEVVDSAAVALTPTGDSLVAKKPGQADLYIRLEQSLLIGEYPDTTVRLHVTGGGGQPP